MHADLAVVEARIREALATSPVRSHLKDVLVEADRDDEGSDFLRILLEVTPLDDVSDDDIDLLVRTIEDGLSVLDDRFPSVRFSDAA